VYSRYGQYLFLLSATAPLRGQGDQRLPEMEQRKTVQSADFQGKGFDRRISQQMQMALELFRTVIIVIPRSSG